MTDSIIQRMTRLTVLAALLLSGCGAQCPTLETRAREWAAAANLEVRGVVCNPVIGECSLNTNNGVLVVETWTPYSCTLEQRLK